MPLWHLVFRCPLCGHDRPRGRGDRAACPACGGRFRRVSGSRVELRLPGGPDRIVDAPGVLGLIEALGGAETDPPGAPLSTRVRAREIPPETPLWAGGELVGFVERPGRGRLGTLTAERDALTFTEDGAGAPSLWPLTALRSLQVASKSLQVQPSRRHPFMNFQLLDASPLRWARLLQTRIAQAWAGEGWGDIVEFQPRIVSGEGGP
jgi:hypothetical protein